jgi:hypothetical protein
MALMRVTEPQRYLGILFYAHACDGSVVKRTFIAFSARGARAKCSRWIDRNY